MKLWEKLKHIKICFLYSISCFFHLIPSCICLTECHPSISLWFSNWSILVCSLPCPSCFTARAALCMRGFTLCLCKYSTDSGISMQKGNICHFKWHQKINVFKIETWLFLSRRFTDKRNYWQEPASHRVSSSGVELHEVFRPDLAAQFSHS